jgi:hypothetical protein
MPKYSSSEIASCVAKAENAANNALWSIERAYLPPHEGAPAAFILLTCFIDFLGTLYAGSESKGDTFRSFVDAFMQQTYNGVGYNANELYSNLRNKLVHNYAIWQGKYVLTHGHPEKHFVTHAGRVIILNLENFFNDVKQAAQEYFAQVKQDVDLQQKLSDRISTVGTIKDVEI